MHRTRDDRVLGLHLTKVLKEKGLHGFHVSLLEGPIESVSRTPHCGDDVAQSSQPMFAVVPCERPGDFVGAELAITLRVQGPK